MHMQEGWLQVARQRCEQSGVRLTRKREQLLQALVGAGRPLSAYDLAEAYGARFGGTLKPMSVYRMLDALIDAHLVHRLASTNQFMVCTGEAHGAEQGVQFLICDQCSSVAEMPMDRAVARSINAGAQGAGFALLNRQLELHGVCAHCSETSGQVPSQ
jgi:Fur family transcriptional regulator, zinc uptake regulator